MKHNAYGHTSTLPYPRWARILICYCGAALVVFLFILVAIQPIYDLTR